MSCCRTLTDQVSAVETARSRLTSSQKQSHRELAYAVTTNLNMCRSILGRYRISRDLASRFRQEIEPDLADVYTAQELAAYATRLRNFSTLLKETLIRWQGRYCKEALSV